MDAAPWTIETICEALGDPALTKKCLKEINKAPVDQLVATVEKWADRAGRIQAAEQRGRELAAADARGEELPGEWIDRTEWVQQEAAKIRSSRGAA
ncbi:hypothetical protein AB0G60_02855 [Streptomyces angustmyceticus]|uniref:Uncharacterized protein n=1 Tax=Streptomyces angustmyceticus TaxID=285578 RepID=A0A5J4L991_9ACTN|nr:hypothetical protein [Streptomyces angustmyceticus]UAL65602.1 hypothetical protein K7396_02825 [Streptomyces angustmyceticus]GES27876.1 hypothetical protein San01_03630 [Streptomyces angustmyceticus]